MLTLPARYKSATLLGEGGMSRVYRVHDTIRSRDLALKLASPAESSFLRQEFDSIRQIRHENLIQVFDWGALGSGEAYYTMELIEGGDWGRKFGAPQSEDSVRTILIALMRGLAHLHSHREIHGDLKPGNVLLGEGEILKLSDVGMRGSGVGASGSGTPGYAAPEVWEGRAPDELSDLYSVAVMAYEALTGHHPFEGRTIRDVIRGQLEGWVISPSARGIGLQVGFERILMSTLERNRNLRPQSADDFLEALGDRSGVGQILGGKFVDRHRELALIEAAEGDGSQLKTTLFHINGQPGVGKTVFVNEACQLALSSGLQVLFCDFPAFLRLAFPLQEDDSTSRPQEPSVGKIVESLTSFACGRRLLIGIEMDDSASHQERATIRNVARYLWASAVESRRQSEVLILLTSPEPPNDLEPFETSLTLPPFDHETSRLMVEGYLGRVSLDEELVTRLHDATGGNPAAIVLTLEDLRERNVLARRSGVWEFRRDTGIRSMALESVRRRWSAAWKRLPTKEQALLGPLAMTSSGIPGPGLFEITSDPDTNTRLNGLESAGWIRRQDSRWCIPSLEVREAILQGMDSSTSEKLLSRLVALDAAFLAREDRAVLMLQAGDNAGAVVEGLWATERAALSGNHRAAIERARQLISLASRLGEQMKAREASLLLAESLFQLGRPQDAIAELQDQKLWEDDGPKPEHLARRANLLGRIRSSLGELDEARAALKRAINIASLAGDTRMTLRSYSELAELDWRHGDSRDRDRAVAVLRSATHDYRAIAGTTEEYWALIYQLGASLVISGQRQEARQILTDEIENIGAPFWRMRAANALATAVYYLGEANEALMWFDEAWRCAELSGSDTFRARILANRAGALYALGRFREAVEHHRQSEAWAKRIGSSFETSAGALGASINLYLLASYEAAIEKAREAKTIAQGMPNWASVAKGIELEALCMYQIGSYEECATLLQSALAIIDEHGAGQVEPRLEWLSAKLETHRGNFERAQRLLEKAAATLERIRDWEDLPGVQIEMEILRCSSGKARPDIARVLAINAESARRGAPTVQLGSALAAGELAGRVEAWSLEIQEVVLGGFQLAERTGAREYAWRLSYWLGDAAMRKGDARSGHMRLAHSIRLVREIAGELSRENQGRYMSTPHARLLVRRLSEATSG